MAFRYDRVWTAVPDKTPPAAGYPVLYMLDGNAVMDKLDDAFLQQLFAGSPPVSCRSRMQIRWSPSRRMSAKRHAACDGMLYRGKTVAVVGGGNTAVGDALHLAKLAAKVYLVHRRGTLRAAPVYRQALDAVGVEIVWNARPAALLRGADGRLTGLRVADTASGAARDIACDGVFAAIGRVPDTALFRGQVELDAAGYLLADETTRTSVPGVFAVGDARAKAVRQVVTATADGAAAIHFAQEYLAEQGGGLA